jgi:hypothetical protein
MLAPPLQVPGSRFRFLKGFTMKRSLLAIVLILSVVTLAWAARSTALSADFLPTGTTYGVSDDGDSFYTNGIQGVKCYFGVNNQNANLVTYSTGRKLEFRFDPAAPAAITAGLTTSSPVAAEVDFYGINYYGQFQSMDIGTTAQVKGSLQFKANNTTYELAYPALAVMRTSSSTWLITTNPSDIPGFPGFNASDAAQLSSFRKRSQTVYGGVNMPLRFELTIL